MLADSITNGGDNLPLPTAKLSSKETAPKQNPTKKPSIVLNSNDVRANSHRRRSSALAPPSPGLRPRSPRTFDNINEDSENLQVPPLGKIVWFAKQGLWQALDTFLDKQFQENSKIQLKFDPELLAV